MSAEVEDFAAPGDYQWWLDPEFDKHTKVTSVVKSIRTNQASRKVDDLIFETLYGGLPAQGFGLGVATRSAATSRLTLNVCRNMVGAVVSKIAAKNKPKPTFLTDEGDYELKQKAQDLEKFVEGVFYESGVYAALSRCFRHACIYGTGILKIFEGDGRVEVEPVLIRELTVDDGECISGNSDPRNMYQRKYMDRLEFLKKALRLNRGDEARCSLIRAALATRQAIDPEDTEYGFQTTADQVLVTEAWHLGEDKDTPGRHAICCETVTIVDEPWEGGFPFAIFRWSEGISSFYGTGLIAELIGIQREINKLLQQIQRGHHLITGHWLVENGSRVLDAKITNDLAAIIRFSGTMPSYQAPAIIAPEVYQHLWQLYAKAFEISGISQLNATGMKPAGLDSGEAQRVYQDIQTERFLEVGQAFEELVVEAARQVVRCAKRIGGGYRVGAEGKTGVHFIDFSEVDIPEDLIRIKVFPTSLLPTQPAGRLAWAQDMIKNAQMPPEDALDIIDFPDTKSWVGGKLAARKVIERNIAHMLKTGEYQTPEPADNHKLAMVLVNEAYQQARLDNVPEKKKQLLLQYLADTTDYLTPPAPPPAPPMPGPMGPPGPLPPPVNGAPPPIPPMPLAA